MITPEVKEYVRSQLASRISKETIRASLQQNGWAPEDIEAVLDTVTSQNITNSAGKNTSEVTQSANATSFRFGRVLTVAVIAFVLILVVGGVVYEIQQQNSPEAKLSQIIQQAANAPKTSSSPITPASSETLPTQPIITSDLATSTTVDSIYKYQINFPAGWIVSAFGDAAPSSGLFDLGAYTVSGGSNKVSCSMSYTTKMPRCSSPNVSISVNTSSLPNQGIDCSTLEKCVGSYMAKNGFSNASTTYLMVGQQKEVLLENTTVMSAVSVDAHDLTLFVENNGKLYLVEAYVSPADLWHIYSQAIRASLLSFRVTQ